MATAMGFRPVKHLNGSPWNGQVNTYKVDGSAADLYVGDVVTLDTDGLVTNLADGAGTNILGVFMGRKLVENTDFGGGTSPHGNINDSRLWVDGSTDGDVEVLICDATDVIFEAVMDNAIVDLDVGDIKDYNYATGSGTTGISNAGVADATVGTSCIQLLGLVKRADNPSAANNAVHCRIIDSARIYS